MLWFLMTINLQNHSKTTIKRLKIINKRDLQVASISDQTHLDLIASDPTLLDRITLDLTLLVLTTTDLALLDLVVSNRIGTIPIISANNNHKDLSRVFLLDDDRYILAFSAAFKDIVSENVRNIQVWNHQTSTVLSVEEPTKANASQDDDLKHQDRLLK